MDAILRENLFSLVEKNIGIYPKPYTKKQLEYFSYLKSIEGLTLNIVLGSGTTINSKQKEFICYYELLPVKKWGLQPPLYLFMFTKV